MTLIPNSSKLEVRLLDPRFVWVSRIVLAAVFLVYGASKIPNLDDFARSIENYQLLPDALVNALAITLPWIEVVAALALLFRRSAPGAVVTVGGMTLVFTIAIISALMRGLDINCGCLDTGTDADARNNLLQHLVFDLFLLVLAAHVWWWARRNEAAL
ncbi:MAG TPA: MauE/DoxX family redox-associated membrane protein [Candidatus Latescibacteria bacterium]|nr:MauE/DoxX family redox-associated membrane protein [Candidatus Latescibacterota bacterium]